MNRRWLVLAGALALALVAPQATAAVAPGASRQPGVRTDRGADTENGLDRLRAGATAKLRVHRASGGAVDFVSSTNGRAMLEEPGTHSPARTAADQLARYGETFGIDGALSRAVVKKTINSTTGGSVVRSEQVVDGVPVFGGQIVMSLDEDQGVVSVDAATTEATEVPDAVVSETKARGTALAVAAKTHRVAAGELTVSSKGRRLYDPAIVHTSDAIGVRPVWQFEVTNGFDVRETVLVGTGRGEVALHFNDAPEINRRICDNAGAATMNSASSVPECDATAVRIEGGAATSVADVDQAHDNLGATSDTYLALGGRDLTDIIGTGTTKKLMSTVRWCFTDTAPVDMCPFQNAFWDGTQMVFGTGYAAADDVVAHELTHGYVERTSALFAFHQSAALNESLADVIGEVVDHRNDPSGTEDNSAWDLGEDIPGGAIRNLKDPTEFDQPDKMTSALFVNADVTYDNGAVHDNDGVGNKTAYLISQGGTFNGRTIAGIDSGDPGLAKTGRLYLETIPRLTSGAEYADLGLALGTTCDELVAAAVGGFTSANCANVRTAAAATELSSTPTDPTAAAPEASTACPTGYDRSVLQSDSDSAQDFGWSLDSLWQRTPANGTPTWAHEGASSLFAWNPDPQLGDPASSNATTSGFVVPAGQPTYLHFHHAYIFEWNPASGGFPATYYDGAQVSVEVWDASSGSWTNEPGLPWVNGPTRTLESSTSPGFGGDSHGYGSSRVDVSTLAGKTVRMVLRVVGDESSSLLGWFVDDVQLYTCLPLPPAAPTAPTAPRSLSAKANRDSARITWARPAQVPGGLLSYLVTRDGSSIGAGTETSKVIYKRAGARGTTVSVRARDRLGQVGPASTITLYPTVARTAVSTSKVNKRLYVTIRATITRAGTSTRVRQMPLLLLRAHNVKDPWRVVGRGTSANTGTKPWRVLQTRSARYQVVSTGTSPWFGSGSSVTRVQMR